MPVTEIAPPDPPAVLLLSCEFDESAAVETITVVAEIAPPLPVAVLPFSAELITFTVPSALIAPPSCATAFPD